MKKAIVWILLCALLFALSAAAFAEESEKRTVACLGDSITYGDMPYAYGRHSRTYPDTLGELLGEDWEVGNFGRSGASVTRLGLCYADRRECRAGLELAADVYLIMLGSNDSVFGEAFDAEDFEQKLSELVDACRSANPDTRIWLMTPPFTLPHEGTNVYSLGPELLGGEIYESVTRVAEEKETGLLDIYTLVSENTDWIGEDGVHFTQEGYQALGEAVYAMIREELEA